jgi:hypothetical protein
VESADGVSAVEADTADFADAEAPAADKPKRTRTRKPAAAKAEAAEAPFAESVPVAPASQDSGEPVAAGEKPQRSRTQRVDPRGLTATGEAVTGHYNS